MHLRLEAAPVRIRGGVQRLHASGVVDRIRVIVHAEVAVHSRKSDLYIE
ncbi:hypothetical protein [Actinomadura sp. NBRC 104412]|nr:hypothetical protein [Actinomadura sp. NBRC 104412]